LDTNFLWSIYYDRQVGTLSGQTSGFTSSFKIFNNLNISNQFVMYVPYTMYEITESQYNSGSCSNWISDTLITYMYQATGVTNPLYSIATFWENSGSTRTGMNVWNNCTDFNTDATTYGIRVGSSTTYGPPSIPTPTPTSTPIPTPTPSPTPGGITPTPTATPIPIPSGPLFFYDPGNISSYPGSGSILYDLSGNGRNANINTGITWTSGSMASFNLDGTDNNSITGTTLSQTYTSWSMWMGLYRNDTGSIGGFDGYMYERTGPGDGNGLGQYLALTNQLDISVNNGTEIPEASPGRMVSGSWMFIAGAIDNTTYTSQVYTSGSATTFISGSKAAGSSNFNNAIVLGEDKEVAQDRTMNGRIGPVLMYDRKLSTTDLTQINDYFKTRYGI
jgi:hypothetical protein